MRRWSTATRDQVNRYDQGASRWRPHRARSPSAPVNALTSLRGRHAGTFTARHAFRPRRLEWSQEARQPESDIQSTSRSRLAAASRSKSGAVAAALSFIFPGLGQAYLGLSRAAIIFAAAGHRRAARRRPADRSPAAAWSASVLGSSIPASASRLRSASLLSASGGSRPSSTRGAADAAHRRLSSSCRSCSSCVVGVVDVWGAYVALPHRQRAASPSRTSTGDPTLDDGPRPPITPVTDAAPGETPDPLATPTPRPPDYVDPSGRSRPTSRSPSISRARRRRFDITAIDAQNDGWLNVLLVGIDW